MSSTGKRLILCKEGENPEKTEDTIIVNGIESAKKVIESQQVSSVTVTEEWIGSTPDLMSLMSLLGRHPILELIIQKSLVYEMADFSKALSDLKGLIVIECNFSNVRTSKNFRPNASSITDSDMTKLSRALANLKSLSLINLNFYDNHQITNEGLKVLSEALTNLKHLTSVNLDFSCEFVIMVAGIFRKRIMSDDGLAMLSDALTNLKDLTSITLNFKNTQVTQAAKDKMKQKFKTFIIQ